MILQIIFYGICVSWLLFLWSRRKFYILSTKIGGPLGYPIIGLGLEFIHQENPRWSQHRKLLNPAFNHKILLSFFPIFNKEIKVLINKLSKYVGKGPIDLPIMFQQCTLDTTFQTTMGKVRNFQSGENVDILKNCNDLLKYITQRMVIPWYLNDFLFQFADIKKQFDEVTIRCREFVSDLIQEKVKRANLIKDENIDSTSYKNDEFNITKSRNIFLDQAFQLMKTNKFTKYDVESESNTIIGAAYETTSNTLYVTLMCLAMFPEYQDRLFDEIISIFPHKDIDLTYDDTKQMVYLEMVINESMRLFAPIPVIVRKCTEDFDLGNGIIIPEGTQIAVDMFNMQRCENIWGPKAKTFDPDHFLKDNFLRMHPYSFIPFAKGLRNCIGSRYGMMALKVFLAQIIRSYRFTTDFKYEDLKYVEDLSIKFIETPLLEVHERNV